MEVLDERDRDNRVSNNKLKGKTPVGSNAVERQEKRGHLLYVRAQEKAKKFEEEKRKKQEAEVSGLFVPSISTRSAELAAQTRGRDPSGPKVGERLFAYAEDFANRREEALHIQVCPRSCL